MPLSICSSAATSAAGDYLRCRRVYEIADNANKKLTPLLINKAIQLITTTKIR
ncbi:hypothetical protein HMPREF1502_5797 [Klebsiella sp. AS10]|nr:hypothetical protein HMPREF1502_5797 [Klebsiella sp. AS10]